MIRAQEYQDGLIKLPIRDDTVITKGQGLIWGADASGTGSYTALIDCANKAENIFAVAAEGRTTEINTHLGTPLLYQAIVQMVENRPIWKIYYDLTASTDLSVQS